MGGGTPSHVMENGSYEASETSAQSVEIATELIKGATFYKYSERSSSQCKVRHVQLSQDKKRLQWRSLRSNTFKDASAIEICDVVSVESGFSDDTGPFFHRPKPLQISGSPRTKQQQQLGNHPSHENVNGHAEESRCFSILVRNGSNLHLEAATSTARAKWVHILLRTLLLGTWSPRRTSRS